MTENKDTKVATKARTVKKDKLVKAEVNVVVDPTRTAYVFNQQVDRMEIPKEYAKIIDICRFFYKRDPIAGTVLNKMVDIAISEMRNQKGKCSDEEFEVYDSLKEILQEFYRCVCLEYLLSGLVVPHYEWSRKKGSDLSDKLNSRRRVWVPDNIWFRDPATVRIEQSPIPNIKWYYVTISMDLIAFIKSAGKRKDGTFDKKTYQALVDNYPEFVAAVKALKGTKMEVLLDNVRPILSRTLPESAYPVPYMNNALESLMHKRNLRKMDYSIAARVTAAIQMIKLGNDDFPCTDESDFEHIKNQINYKNLYGNQERVYQLFANHTLEITWVYPDTEAMLNQEKYRAVDDDIISGLGFPRTLITGETLRSNVSAGADVAVYSPIATMTAIRDVLVEWTKELYNEIKIKNGFSYTPKPRFEPMKLYKLLDISEIGMGLYQEGSLSRTTRLEMFGLDLENELERKAEERKLYKEYGITEAPQLPFSSPQIGQPNTNQDNPQNIKDTKKVNNKKERLDEINNRNSNS